MARASVLVIDANEHDRCFLASILQEADLAVSEADNTKLAVARIRSRRPAAVLLDLHLPHGDSYELLANLKKDPTLREIPVFAMSSPLSPHDEQKSLQSGCLAYFEKPLDADDVITRLKAEVRRVDATQ